MLHGSQIYIVETAALLIVLFALTMLWRIARALGKIANQPGKNSELVESEGRTQRS
jgi:ABC-type nickel/cobalt efflux system permease component RcnA